MVVSLPQGKKEMWLVGPPQIYWGDRFANLKYDDPNRLNGIWLTKDGRTLKIANTILYIKRGDEQLLWAQYKDEGSHVRLWPNAYSKETWVKRAKVDFISPVRMVWQLDGEKIDMVWVNDYAIRPIIYDMDAYRISSDYYKGVAPGGSNSWSLGAGPWGGKGW